MKIKDIYTTLSEYIDIQKFHPPKKIKVDTFNHNKNISEFSHNYTKHLNIEGKTSIRIKKNKSSKHFDAIIKSQEDDICLQKNGSTEKKMLLKKKTLDHMYGFFSEIFSYLNNLKLTKYIIALLVFFLIIFIDKQAIEHFTNNGYKELLSIQNSQAQLAEEKNPIINSLNTAQNNFTIASILFLPFSVLPGQDIKNASQVISGGREASITLKKVYMFGEEINKLSNKKGIENIMFSQLLLNNKDFFVQIEQDLYNIQEIYSKIIFSESDDELQEKLNQFEIKMKQAQYYIGTLNKNYDTFLETLGHSKRKKYLIAFQNNDEIRAQGGFMGSLGILEIFRGQVKKFTKNDVYFHEFKIKKDPYDKEIAPEGINKLTPYLGLRDANYYINNKDSSEKIKDFMKKSGEEIDGIIYVNQNTLLQVFDLIGEYDSKVLNTKVNSQDFSLQMSLLVESKVSKEGTTGTPKQILFNFMQEFFEKIVEKNISNIELAKILLSDIENREILFYNFFPKERELLQALGLYNTIDYGETLDFSYPVFTSISGNKSDRYIQRSYYKTVSKGKKCSYDTSLEILLEHTFNDKEEEKIQEIIHANNLDNKQSAQSLTYIQGKSTNKQFIRVIIPKNAQIKNKNISLKSYSQRGKSAEFYLNTEVGKKSSYTLEYTIPNLKCQTYNYKQYKQPGIKEYNFHINSFGKTYDFIGQKKDVYFNK